ncbi:MAG: hypothetical protein C4548_14020 [Desulfobacteraceae bacterium]|nr:MAG: hypothetical protein C4548_14020 [Desulfobacteraceae bacterium]
MAIVFLSVLSCGKPKEGKVIITEQEFFLRQDSSHAYVVDARGKVQNVGDVDVRRIVLTGYCRSCDDALAPGRWMGAGEDRTSDQKAVVGYLSVGEKAEFTFKGVAFIYQLVPEPPAQMPDTMEIIVESFETVR